MEVDAEDLLYNPFASPIDTRPRSLSSSSLNARSYSPYNSASPNDNSQSYLSAEGSGRADTLAEAEASIRNSQHHHPLRSAGLATGFRDAGITRPHLTRALDNGRLVDVASPEDNFEDTDLDEAKSDEKVVIVHEISSKDSLAGVALKYGINLTELRRANHLWASDSIHLRKVLYIPLDQSTSSQLHAAHISSSNEPISSDSSPRADNTQSSLSENEVTTFSPPTIRRIPASELSFFPPRSKSSALALSTPSPPVITQQSKYTHTRYATSPAPSLNTILTALPIAASTRDTIIARLSFDSASSSYSDRDHDPYFSDRDHEGHELDDVQARRDAHALAGGNPTAYSHGGLQNGHRSSSGLPSRTNSDPHTINYGPKSRYEGSGGSGRGRSFSEEYMGPPPLPSEGSMRIRNIQLEPSPVMEIPGRSEISQFRSHGQKLDSRKSKMRPRLSSVNFNSFESLEEIQMADED